MISSHSWDKWTGRVAIPRSWVYYQKTELLLRQHFCCCAGNDRRLSRLDMVRETPSIVSGIRKTGVLARTGANWLNGKVGTSSESTKNGSSFLETVFDGQGKVCYTASMTIFIGILGTDEPCRSDSASSWKDP